MDVDGRASSLEVHSNNNDQIGYIPLQNLSNSRYTFELCPNGENDTVNATPVNRSFNFPTNVQMRIPGLNSRSVHTLPQHTLSGDTSSRTATRIRSSVVSVVEGRRLAAGEVGIAYIDLIGSTLILSQFSDNISYHRLMAKLDVYNPVELILPSSMSDETKNTLSAQLKRKFRDIQVTGVERRFFNEGAGIDYVRKLCNSDFEQLEIALKNKYYCLSACAGLIRYVEYVQSIMFIEKSLKVEYRNSENTVMIDFTTARSLEIIVNQSSPKSADTLFGLLDNTKTRSGSRFLRATLMEPPSDLSTIESRLDCVEMLLTNPDILLEISHILSRFVDVENLISVFVQKPKVENEKTCERKIDAAILLKSTLEMIPLLRQVLSHLKNPIFDCHKNMLNNSKYEELREIISRVIRDECKVINGAINIKTQKCYAIRDELSPGLEIARKTYHERIDDVLQLQRELSDKYNIPLQIAYGAQRGYYFYFNQNETPLTVRQLPSEFVKVVTRGKNLQFMTEELIRRNSRVFMVYKEVLTHSAHVVNGLFTQVRDYIPYLQQLSAVLSYIDLMVSFAEAAINNGLVKPDFGDSLDIVEGWHPILGKDRASFVNNDTSMSRRNNLMILTGPNMSGKSTYLKQVALLYIMAQSGSFVAANKATFRITKQIFSRLGTNDDIESNSSTFMVEMKETFYILQNLTENSVVIIDELGRGTSREDGLGLCIAVAEQLIHSNAYTFFVTHFSEVTQLVENYATVSIFHFQVDFESGDDGAIMYTHKIKKGRVPDIDYAIKLAKVSLIREIVTEAENTWKSSQTPHIPQFEENREFKIGSFLLDLIEDNEKLTEETLNFLSSIHTSQIRDTR